MNDVLRNILKRAFVKVVGGCNIQNGWPCRTCFWSVFEEEFGLNEDEVHALWLIQLKLRNPSGITDPPTYLVKTEITGAGRAHQLQVEAYQAKLRQT
jgi:hypothetical protein